MPVGCLWTYWVLNVGWNCFCEAVMIKNRLSALSPASQFEFSLLFSCAEFVRMLKRIENLCNKVVESSSCSDINFYNKPTIKKVRSFINEKKKWWMRCRSFRKPCLFRYWYCRLRNLNHLIALCFTNVRLIERFPFWMSDHKLERGVYYLLRSYHFWRISASYFVGIALGLKPKEKGSSRFYSVIRLLLVFLYAMNKFLELRGC